MLDGINRLDTAKDKISVLENLTVENYVALRFITSTQNSRFTYSSVYLAS
jgi:hypothetical protein